MPSNEQRRQAAKRKLERQLTRRAERAKKRRIWGVSITVIVVIAVVGVVYWIANLGPDDNTAAANPTDDAAKNTTKGQCGYAESPAESPAKKVGLPEDPAQAKNTGTVTVTLKTNHGAIPLTLDRAKAPCTVQSIVHLAEKKFFDGTSCHRMTASEGLKVLQCGDPEGTGGGGPGYTIPDELPTDLAQGPAGPDGSPSVIYPRGSLAMANAGPNTGGSQFFMVYADSTLAPKYTVFGSIDAPGMIVLDNIAAGGVTPGQNGPEDGAPKLPVTIESAVAK